MNIINTSNIITVPSTGPLDCKIAFIGEAPGSQEIKLGEPFVGQSGQLFNSLLSMVGIVRSGCYITNTIKEQPYRNNIKLFIDLSKKVPITSPFYDKYVKELKEELSKCKANVLVAVGAVPLYALTGQRGITKRRGSMYESTLLPGRKVIPIIHPAAALRQYLWQHYILLDLAKIKREAETPQLNFPASEIIISPSFIDSMNYLIECRKHEIVAYDIEVSNHELSCISFSHTKGSAISIPFTEGGREYFPPDQECKIMKEIALLLEDTNVKKLAQNASFDNTFMFRKYGIKTRPIEDTMVAQAIILPDFPKGLDFITSIHTDEPYYKDEGKFRIKTGKGSDEKFWIYNAKDSLVLMEAFPKMLNELKMLGNLDIYRHQVSLIEPLVYMGERGLRVDYEGLMKASNEAREKLDAWAIELDTLTDGFIKNPNSPVQVKNYFYEEIGEKPYLNRTTHKPSVNEDALKRLARKGYKEAEIMLKIRTLAKLKGTYLDVHLDSDKRLRCAFNPVGTKSGRLSSSKTIFGTGTNMQNQPAEMKQYILADRGQIIYNVDLGQAENRVMAYIAPEYAMIKAFENNIDIHIQTAALIFRKSLEDISEKDGSCPIGSGRYSERFWGKKANHGLNYDLGYKTFAFYYEIPEKEAEFIVSSYHTAYPGIHQYYKWIQAQLRADRTLKNPFGRRRKFMGRWGRSLFKEAYSWIPQSTIADKINKDGVRYIYENQQLFKKVELLNQVHDSIVFQIPISAGLNEHLSVLEHLRKSLEKPITWRAQTFSIPADIEMGLNLKDTFKVDKNNSIQDKFKEIVSDTKA